MGRRIVQGLVVVAVLVVAAAGGLYWYAGRIGVEKVGERLYMMTGVGGNVGVLVTGEGVVVVDTMTFARQGKAIRARIAGITDEPVIAVINTHYHMDHTHGNPAFDPGTKVVATERTLHHLKTRDADYWSGSPAKELLPNDTFTTQRDYRFGNDVVRVTHPGRGHTDGDLVVEFVAQRVIHLGDLFFNGHYPNIDLEAGGTVRGWIDTIDQVKELEFEGVIPGHGPFTDREGLDRYQEFLRALWTGTSEVVRRGGSLADAKKEVDLSSFGMTSMWFAPYLNHDFVVSRTFEEATAKE